MLPEKKFRVEALGDCNVGRENTAFVIFLKAEDRLILDKMEVGETRTMSFISGAGHTYSTVERTA